MCGLYVLQEELIASLLLPAKGYGWSFQPCKNFFRNWNWTGWWSSSNKYFNCLISCFFGLFSEMLIYNYSFQVWNNDVKFCCIKDSLGSPITYFYFDPYSQPSKKKGGAWMNEVVARSCVLSHDGTSTRLPLAQMGCNQSPPVGNKLSLMTFRQVTHWQFHLYWPVAIIRNQ